MRFTNQTVDNYSEQHTSPENQLLAYINRQTHLHVLMPQMLSGHLQGAVLTMIAAMIRPQWILEIGTFTGYSAVCLAEGLAENGKLITIDVNEELICKVQALLKGSKYENQILFQVGKALEIIPHLEQTFDLIFIDADKQNYPQYYELALQKVRKGGFIVIDNVLWNGKVLDLEKNQDKDTLTLHHLNQFIQQDERVSNVLLPIRDGLMVVQKY